MVGLFAISDWSKKSTLEGNGRTGRLLINHELISNDEIPIVIPEERRIEYFNYLQNYDTQGLKNMILELQKVE